MNQKIFTFVCAIFMICFLASTAYGKVFIDTDTYSLAFNGYSRGDVVILENTLDLNDRVNDGVTYFGLDYALSLTAEAKQIPAEIFIKFERNGPFDYDAPIFQDGDVEPSGRVEPYRRKQLLMGLEEAWIDVPLAAGIRFKPGLYAYEVGNGFSLNGSFENMGVSFYKDFSPIRARLYYCNPGISYKNPLGPKIPQEENQGLRYEHTRSQFFAADLKYENESVVVWPYCGLLADYTPSGRRDNLFNAAIKKDFLGTSGLFFSYQNKNILFKCEASKNFGVAYSDSQEFENILHSGFLGFAHLEYCAYPIKPYAKILVCSGNKVSLLSIENQDETFASFRNRAFSVYSPTNRLLGNFVSSANAADSPVVAAGAGYGLNYGISRPQAFAPADFDNLIMPSWGATINLGEKLVLGLDFFYLFSYVAGAGTYENQAFFLSRDLGFEVDASIDYFLTSNVAVGFLGGCFFPGKYYTTLRDDTQGSLASPYLRGDGKADPAFQLEFFCEVSF